MQIDPYRWGQADGDVTLKIDETNLETSEAIVIHQDDLAPVTQARQVRFVSGKLALRTNG